jgi:predicted acylesterase/phospholipase RssA
MTDLIKITEINSLVVAGGGIKGLLFVGAIKLLDDIKVLNRIKYFYGTSIGAFICLIIVLGWSSDEMVHIISKINLNNIMDFNIDTFINNFGFISKNNYELLIKHIITFKGFPENITFLELYKKTNKELNVISHSLRKNAGCNMNYINTPNKYVWEAIYDSSALPGLIGPNFKKMKDDIYLDGGFANNFAMNFVKPENKFKVIGICATSYLPDWDKFTTYIKEKDIINYSLELIRIFFECAKHNYKDGCIVLENSGIPLEYNMDIKKRKEIIKMGYESSKQQMTDIVKKLYDNQLKEKTNRSNIFKYNEI